MEDKDSIYHSLGYNVFMSDRNSDGVDLNLVYYTQIYLVCRRYIEGQLG